MNIPFLDFSHMHKALKSEIVNAFDEVYESGWFILGRQLQEFEKEYAYFNDTDFCIGVSNGLDALILCLKALNIGVGDEVIIPSNTYIATALAVSHVGARPVFVEPRIETYNINPDNIERHITPSTKAIIPVHLYGQACEMAQIMILAEAYSLYVIEDNAQAHASTWSGKMTGSFGQCNATSFYPGKNLGALGDGGAITTNNYSLAERIHMLRNYGSSKKYYNKELGYNNRLDEVQAAFLRVKLRYLEEWTQMRKIIAGWYHEGLKNLSGVITPYTHPKSSHSFHLYIIRTERRDELQNWLMSKGIQTLIHYPIPPHLQDAYRELGYKKGDFPIAEELSRSIISLPLWPGITKNQVSIICGHIKKFYK